jgi:hypothetical protein
MKRAIKILGIVFCICFISCKKEFIDPVRLKPIPAPDRVRERPVIQLPDTLIYIPTTNNFK